jgi:hypothetical protein
VSVLIDTPTAYSVAKKIITAGPDVQPAAQCNAGDGPKAARAHVALL